MSINYHANCGYMLPVNLKSIKTLMSFGLLEFLKQNYDDEIQTEIDIEYLIDEIYSQKNELDIKLSVNGKSVIINIYRYSNEDELFKSNLLDEYLYFQIYEDYLHDKTLTNFGNKLRQLDSFPEFSRWVTQG